MKGCIIPMIFAVGIFLMMILGITIENSNIVPIVHGIIVIAMFGIAYIVYRKSGQEEQVIEKEPIVKEKEPIKFNKCMKIKELKEMKFNKNEIILISIVIGTLVALILGSIFTKHYDVIDGIKVYGKQNKDYYGYKHFEYSEFNYLLAFATLIITSGIGYLYLIKKSTSKRNDKEILEEKAEDDWDKIL